MRRCLSKYLILIVLAGLILSGCGSGVKEDESMSGEGSLEKEITKLPFESINLEDVSDRLQKWIGENKSKKAKKVFHVNGKTYVIIMLGQKPTGGYDVEITQIEHVKNISEGETGNDFISVSHEVKKPEKGSVNTQALTYPVAIAEIDGERKNSFQFTTQIKPEKLEDSNSN